MFKNVLMTPVARKAMVTLALLTLTSTGFAGGGSGSGGGGGVPAGGGGTCSVISKLSASSVASRYGYPWDRVDVKYELKGCAAGFVPAGTITVTNLDNAGTVFGNPYPLANIVGLVGTAGVDLYWLTPYNANIRVDFVVTDPATGAVVESRTLTLVCPPAPAVRT